MNKFEEDVKKQQEIIAAAKATALPLEFNIAWINSDESFSTVFHMWLNFAYELEVGKVYHCILPLKQPQSMLVVKTINGAIAVVEGFSGLLGDSIGFICIARKAVRLANYGLPVWPNATQLKLLFS